MDYNYNYKELLEYINPSELTYQEWVNIGMALKDEGCDVSLWDDWSKRDSLRWHPNDCQKKWATFNGSSVPVTGATIVALAKEGGWMPSHYEDRELDWDDEIGRKDDFVIVNKHYLEGQEFSAPQNFNPAKELITYLETLFEPNENVGYVSESWEKDGKYIPANKGYYDRTAGQLIESLSKCKGDIGSVIGDYSANAGAWIRFNPLDGKGVKNENVTEYKYALVESDSEEIEKQNAIIRELELPVACLVYSGGKSIHAIVRIEASSYDEYRKRVDYLYGICQKNGLEIDRQNRNPSRLSRMPGVTRGKKKQYIIDKNIGKASWNEWKDWIESVNDDLPDPESMESVWDNLPELSPPLIDGVLRQGHKMLIAGPSKAGKSYALIELCCSIAEGKRWLGFNCTQGKVMYVNLELDRASCLHRFKDVYNALDWKPNNLQNIDIWNLRGKSVPMDKLAPKLIRRAAKKNYIAIIIDPIYKVITGDENSADQMAHFCNQFDKVCTELGCAVIYCHHHSKGAQGGKRSMDRASGSGVFARDPDALLDLIELERTEALVSQEKNKAVCVVLQDFLEQRSYGDIASQDDLCSQKEMREICRQRLGNADYAQAMKLAAEAEKTAESRTAWRIEGTLREYPKFSPLNLWFDFPVHREDVSGELKDITLEDSFNKYSGKNKQSEDKRSKSKAEKMAALEMAYESAKFEAEDGEVTINSIIKCSGFSRNSVKNYIDEHPDFERNSKGVVTRK